MESRVLKSFLCVLIVAFLGICKSGQALTQIESLNLRSQSPIFKEALKFADARMWLEAEREVQKIDNRSARLLITWLRLREGDGKFWEYQEFLQHNTNWPGLALLKFKGEHLIDVSVSPEAVISYFQDTAPETGHGALMLSFAFEELGYYEKANDAIKNSWLKHSYSDDDFNTILSKFGSYLDAYNEARIENLLWNRQDRAAQQMIHLINDSRRGVLQVRIALQAEASGVDAMIAELSKNELNDPGLAYDRFQFRRNRQFFKRAEELLVKRSKSKETLGRPHLWAAARMKYARRALLRDEFELAYNIASKHHIDMDGKVEVNQVLAQLEWFSGFLALEFLHKPNLALRHFLNFEKFVERPISQARAGYWLGRTYETLKDSSKATKSYGKAAIFQTSFYGQLAAERGRFPPDMSLFQPTKNYEWENSTFLEDTRVLIAILLFYSDRSVLADRFFNHVSEKMSYSSRLMLAQLATDLGLKFVSLSIAKTSAADGQLLIPFYFPLAEDLLYLDNQYQALVTAIIRTESEFFNAAVSSSGALGLMQIMPNTARSVARKLKVSYSKRDLLIDPSYNIALGSEYLKQMMSLFSNSTILAIASYNAGPYKVKEWIKRFGDPREKGVDPLIWIELLPYHETRNYVMRVLEAQWIYSSLISGKVQSLNRGALNFGHRF